VKKEINILVLLFLLVPGISKCTAPDITDKKENPEITTKSSMAAQITETEATTVIQTQIQTEVQTELQTTSEETEPYVEKMESTGNKKLDSLADSILKNLISDGMNNREKAYAVYKYMVNNMRYSGITKEGDWVSGAYTALSTNKGNCYGFYSGSRALLQRLNITSMEVSSVEKDHYWNLVNIDGSWYHFDTTSGWGGERFLLTDNELSEYSFYNSGIDVTLTYNWDRSLYPKTP
jgi:transglutaminase/protease-like cytokinesis protein 3